MKQETQNQNEFPFPWKPGYNQLAKVFEPGRVTNAYKMFWFWGLLDICINADDFVLSMEDLAIEMLVKVWYPYHYFKLNLGKHDKLIKHIETIKQIEGIEDDISQKELQKVLRSENRKTETKAAIIELQRYVPYRFLTPWFENEISGIKDAQKNSTIRRLTEEYWRDRSKASIYKFVDSNSIWIHSDWLDYLRENYSILKDFTLFNLAKFAQKQNPTVGGILSKLEYNPAERDQATARKLWKPFLELHPETVCIFTGEKIDQFAIDHFIPWSFVAHNEIWNTAPIPTSVNSQKGNKLPLPNTDLENFTQLQYHFFQFLDQDNFPNGKKGKNAKYAIDQYYNFLQTDPKILSSDEFRSSMKEKIEHLLLMASRQRFSYWER